VAQRSQPDLNLCAGSGMDANTILNEEQVALFLTKFKTVNPSINLRGMCIV
jgi:hypothetical protein